MAKISKIKLPNSDTIYELKGLYAALKGEPTAPTPDYSEYTKAMDSRIATVGFVMDVIGAFIGNEIKIDPSAEAIIISAFDVVDIDANKVVIGSKNAEFVLVEGDTYKMVVS